MSTHSHPLDHVPTAQVACTFMNAARNGDFPALTERPTYHQLQDIAVPWSVMIWDVIASGMKHWTDRKKWSSPRKDGDFLTYVQMDVISGPPLVKKIFGDGSELKVVSYSLQESIFQVHKPGLVELRGDVASGMPPGPAYVFPVTEGSQVKLQGDVAYEMPPEHIYVSPGLGDGQVNPTAEPSVYESSFNITRIAGNCDYRL